MRNKQLITLLYSGCEANPEWDCIFIEKDCSYLRSTPIFAPNDISNIAKKSSLKYWKNSKILRALQRGLRSEGERSEPERSKPRCKTGLLFITILL